MLSPDWVFDLVSAVQRFVCDTVDFDLAAVPDAASRLCQAIPEPTNFAAATLLRSTLIELALRWGNACHRALRARCELSPCVPAALASVGDRWTHGGEGPAAEARRAKEAFVEWLNAFCSELERTHPESLARRVAEIIVANLSQPLRVEEIASQVGAHPSSVRRAFRREFQMSMRLYHLRARVECAERLLRDTPHLKIEPIGLSLGWQSKKDFYRAIRQVRGCTPTALRCGLQNERKQQQAMSRRMSDAGRNSCALLEMIETVLAFRDQDSVPNNQSANFSSLFVRSWSRTLGGSASSSAASGGLSDSCATATMLQTLIRGLSSIRERRMVRAF